MECGSRSSGVALLLDPDLDVEEGEHHIFAEPVADGALPFGAPVVDGGDRNTQVVREGVDIDHGF